MLKIYGPYGNHKVFITLDTETKKKSSTTSLKKLGKLVGTYGDNWEMLNGHYVMDEGEIKLMTLEIDTAVEEGTRFERAIGDGSDLS